MTALCIDLIRASFASLISIFPINALKCFFQQVVWLVDRWVEQYTLGALIFPIAANLPKVPEGKISGAKVRGPPGENRVDVPLRVGGAPIGNDRPFCKALVRVTPHQEPGELVFRRHKNRIIKVPLRCAHWAIAPAIIGTYDPAAAITDEPGPGLFSGLEHRLTGFR
jgi:hypothetical protein